MGNITLCMCVYMYVCICVCVYICHDFFIHLSVDGHLGCFHMLAILTKAAINIVVRVSFQISDFFLDRYPRVELLGLFSVV